MGIEYPYLAILAVVAFTMAIMGVLYFFIHTYTEMLKTPILSTYAEACYTESNVYLNITLKHERGLPVILQRIEVYSDRGVITYTLNGGLTSIYVELEGFNGRLGPGQVGFIKIMFPQGYFTLNKTYSGLIFFDMGNTLFTFQLVKCPQITPTTPVTLRAKLIDMNTLASSGTVTALGTITIPTRTATIDLYSRENVFYNDTFNTDPFKAGRLINLTCNWNYDPINKTITINATSRPDTYGGECIAIVNKSLPSSGVVYIASIVKAITGEGYADIVLIQNSSALYTLGMYFGPRGVQGYEIWKYVEKLWKRLNGARNETFYNTSYNIVGIYAFNIGYLELWSNRSLMVSGSDLTITPLQTGIGVYTAVTSNKMASASTVLIAFNNLLVTFNTPPWFVNVTNVPIGWSVVLRDVSGNIISSMKSTGGNVSLDVWDYFIVSNGTIEVYDDRGVLVGAKTFNYIMGGEVYRVSVYEYRDSFTGLVIGVGGSSKILIYNISSSIESPILTHVINADTIFDGRADIALSLDYLYLLNTSGVFNYDFLQGKWVLVTDSCRATGISARLEVVKDVLVIVPGVGDNTLCLYNLTTKSPVLYNIVEGYVTEYTSTTTSESILYVSLNSIRTLRPIIVVYNISNNSVNFLTQYNITGYRLLGLTRSDLGKLYFIYEYGGVYELDITTSTLRLLPLILPFIPRGFGDRLEYYGGYLIFIRGDETTELYIVSLTT
jgi:hypothetical protein